MADAGVKLAVEPKMTAACLETRGPYQGVGDAMRELEAWLRGKGVEGAGPSFCLFYDNPFETPEGDLRAAVCIPIRTGVAPEGKFEVREFAETEAAETRHDGPPEEFGKTYGPFLEGLIGAGYDLVGPAREYFNKAADVRGPGSGFVIRQPIAKR